jgi:hypothetical protein
MLRSIILDERQVLLGSSAISIPLERVVRSLRAGRRRTASPRTARVQTMMTKQRKIDEKFAGVALSAGRPLRHCLRPV